MLDAMTLLVLQMRREQVARQREEAAKPKQLWSLYYGSSTKPSFGPAPYHHCVSERNRQIGFNPRLKKELFKIK